MSDLHQTNGKEAAPVVPVAGDRASTAAASPPRRPPPTLPPAPPSGNWDGGGAWTEIKLDAVSYYLECYTKALTQVGFDLWYIDAFAGSGSRQATRFQGGLFEGEPLELVTETLAGSARRALAISPPFRHFIFNEKNPARNQALQRLKLENPQKDVRIFDGDANDVIKNILAAPPWNVSRVIARGVVFLDPFALQVDWGTLELLAKTGAVDVWYLFPLRDITRQLAHRKSGIGAKAPKLDRSIPRWRDLYSLPPSQESWRQTQLFDEDQGPDEERNASQKQIEAWFKSELETIFGHVSEPLPLLTGQSRQLFSLFLCVANRSDKAVALSKHFHGYVMKNFAPGASRRTSGP